MLLSSRRWSQFSLALFWWFSAIAQKTAPIGAAFKSDHLESTTLAMLPNEADLSDAGTVSIMATTATAGVAVATPFAPNQTLIYMQYDPSSNKTTSEHVASVTPASQTSKPATSAATVKYSMTEPTSTPSTSPNSETRLRWVDFRRHHAYPPRVPPVPGIPSGFRNPLATSTVPPQPSSGQMYNPGAHHSSFGGSSSNPVGFGGSVIMDEEAPFPAPNPNRRYNITRVEHIVAECSDEYMKVVIRFNGTFTGLVYSSGYVHDPNCIYVNGSGRSYYEFFIRLNQCGTLGRQEMYHPTMPGEARRRDQLMWNTLSIQYNAMIEEEFDEHFRLTCEYGSDFWKTVTFPSVNVEVNTGSPVVFTINPPQCQMEVRRGFGIAGSRTAGPVTVGDPLTLLIHMKSEKAGFDILVKNCVAHNGAQQRMQLIDSNGCVTNDKLISPFRGTYNSENGHQVSLYSYLKAFRFTGSPALYLECDIHMCHNRCPPQRCYWRNLSKRSAKSLPFEEQTNSTSKPVVSESISLFQALEVHHEQDEKSEAKSARADLVDENLVCLRSGGLTLILVAFVALMSLSLGTSICYCQRMRRVKYFQRSLSSGIRQFGPEGSILSHSTLKSACSASDCSSILADSRYRDQFSRFR